MRVLALGGSITEGSGLEAGRKTNSAEGEHFDRYYEYFARGLTAAYPRVNASATRMRTAARRVDVCARWRVEGAAVDAQRAPRLLASPPRTTSAQRRPRCSRSRGRGRAADATAPSCCSTSPTCARRAGRTRTAARLVGASPSPPSRARPREAARPATRAQAPAPSTPRGLRHRRLTRRAVLPAGRAATLSAPRARGNGDPSQKGTAKHPIRPSGGLLTSAAGAAPVHELVGVLRRTGRPRAARSRESASAARAPRATPLAAHRRACAPTPTRRARAT